MMEIEKLRPAARICLKILPVTLFLYSISLLTTMAGMEIFSWTSAALVLAVFAIQWKTDFHPWQGTQLTVDWALWILFFIIVLGAFMRGESLKEMTDIIGRGRFIVLFMILRQGIRWVWTEKLVSIEIFLSVLALLIGFYAIFQHFTGMDLIRGPTSQAVLLYGYRSSGAAFYRSAGMFSSPMRYGSSAGIFICFPLALFLLKVRKVSAPRVHWLMGFTFLVMAVSLLATFTRGVWIGVAAAVFVMCAYNGWRFFLKSLMAGVLSLAVLFTFVPDVRARVLTIFNTNYQSNTERVDIWRANWQMFKEYPIIGVGYGRNEDIIDGYYTKLGIKNGMHGHAHNNYFQFLSGTGLPGLLCYLFFSGYFLWICHRLWRMLPEQRRWERSLVLGAIGGQVYMHVAGLTECNFKHAEVNHLYMFMLGVVVCLYLNSRDEHGLMIVRPKNEERARHAI